MPDITFLLKNIGLVIYDRTHPPPEPPIDLTGRTVIVTGSNVGVAFEAAVKFVAHNAAKVILGVRSLKKGEDARAAIEERTGRKGVVEVWQMDMGDYESLRTFVKRVEGECERVDFCVLNAGVAKLGFEKSQYGWEVTLQVNTLSTILLSILLLPKLRASKTDSFIPVLEIVSSSNHTHTTIKPAARTAPSPLDFYNTPRPDFDGTDQYGVSKLFLQFAHTGLVKHLGPVEKSQVEIVTICPGATKSDILRNDIPFALKLFQKVFFHVFMKPTEQGARAYVGGVDLKGKGHGRFYRWGKVEEPAPSLTGPENEKLQERVWQDILRALRKDVPEVDHILASVASN